MNSIWSCTPLPSNLLHHGDLLDLDADMKEIFLERLPTGISLLFYIYNDDWWSRLQLSVLYPTLHNYFLKCILLNSLFNSTFAFQGKMSKNKSSSVAFFYLPASPDSFASMGAVPVLIVSVLHQNEGGIGKSIPVAQEISRDPRDVLYLERKGLLNPILPDGGFLFPPTFAERATAVWLLILSRGRWQDGLFG